MSTVVAEPRATPSGVDRRASRGTVPAPSAVTSTWMVVRLPAAMVSVLVLCVTRSLGLPGTSSRRTSWTAYGRVLLTVIWMVPESARKLIVLGRTCTPWAAASMDPSTAPRSCVQAWEPPRHRAEVSCWIAAVQARAPGASWIWAAVMRPSD